MPAGLLPKPNFFVIFVSSMESYEDDSPELLAHQLRILVRRLQALDRNDLLLSAIGVPTLEALRIEAAKGTLSPLVITSDYRLILEATHTEVVLSPVHKAVYLLFLNHPEGIEFKHLASYRGELLSLYHRLAPYMEVERMEETVDRLTNPLDNAINEKCSRIKAAFSALMDEYSASYYIIGSHTTRHVEGSSRIWFRRLKIITLPRRLVKWQER